MFGRSKRNDPFFAAFVAHADVTVKAAALLREMFADPTRNAELVKKIEELEHEGDRITHDTIARLHKQWITPLDRADIHGLITQLDDTLDLVEAVAERMAMFEIESTTELARELVDVLVKTVEGVAQAVKLLPERGTPKPILDLCVEINRQENRADELYRAGLAQLYKPGGDPLHVMKWRDIFECLEDATDFCEDVANTLEGIVLEYS